MPRGHRHRVAETRLAAAKRPAAPEEQGARGVVAVESRGERAQLVRRARVAESAGQRPLDADRAHFLAEPGIDGRIRIRERALPAEVDILERKRRVERTEANLL